MANLFFEKYKINKVGLRKLIYSHPEIPEVEPRVHERRFSLESQKMIEAILEKRRIDLKDALSPHTYKRDEVAETLAAALGKSKVTAFGILSKSTVLLTTAFKDGVAISFYYPEQILVIQKELGVEGLEQKILDARKKKAGPPAE